MSLKAALALMVCTLATHGAVARDTEYKLKFADVQSMSDSKIKTRLDDSIKLYFADQPTPKVAERLGEETSNKKTNGFGKDDEFGCKWAAYSALVALQERARQLGANAVVGIDIDYEVLGEKNGMLMVTASGTAVQLG